jgi:hypothetical protein
MGTSQLGGYSIKIAGGELQEGVPYLRKRLLPLSDLHLTRFKGCRKSVLVAVGNGPCQRVLFRGAFEPSDYQVSGGQPTTRHFAAGELAFFEEGIDRVGGDAKHLGGGLDVKDVGVSGKPRQNILGLRHFW